jgi:hypothetical protein
VAAIQNDPDSRHSGNIEDRTTEWLSAMNDWLDAACCKTANSSSGQRPVVPNYAKAMVRQDIRMFIYWQVSFIQHDAW